MGALNINTKVKPLTTVCELSLHRGFNDPSNPCDEDIQITGGTPKFRLRTGDVNGDDASPDTDVLKRCWIGRLGPSYVPASGLSIKPVAHVSRAPGTSAKVDVEFYKLDAGGVAGSDLVTTSEIDLAAITTPTQQTFAVNGASLTNGDRFLVVARISVNDTGAAGGSADMYGFLDRCDIEGQSRGGFVFVEV